jgi:hypothetical protein
MKYIGRRTMRSLMALASVVAASFGTSTPAAAAGTGCGGGSGCVYSCGYYPNFCKVFGCNTGSCNQSYSCGLFGYLYSCYPGGFT